jgi:undecaprenyl diphosphate synthase
MTSARPAVDFLIRTGGEPHLSAGFMMWDVADSQLYFSEKNFPDFNNEEFGKALDDYASRGKRLGS